MSSPMENQQRKWYSEPYVWLLIALPLSAVFGGILTIWYAVISNDGLVVDDYYRRGLEINRTLGRDNAAGTHGLKSTLQFNPDENRIRIILESNLNYILPEKVTVSFLHSTRAGHDKKTKLARTAGNVYEDTIAGLIKGRWHILIEADDWRLLESITIH